MKKPLGKRIVYGEVKDAISYNIGYDKGYEQGKKDGIKKVYTLWKETKSYKDAGNRVVVFDTDLKRLAGS